MEKLLQWNLPPSAQSLLNIILIWIGFAIVVGLIARLIVPGKLTRGPLVTLLIGLTGCCIGPMALSCYYPIDQFNPIGLVGFIVSVLAAIGVLLLFHFLMLFFPQKKKDEEK